MEPEPLPVLLRASLSVPALCSAQEEKYPSQPLGPAGGPQFLQVLVSVLTPQVLSENLHLTEAH